MASIIMSRKVVDVNLKRAARVLLGEGTSSDEKHVQSVTKGVQQWEYETGANAAGRMSPLPQIWVFCARLRTKPVGLSQGWQKVYSSRSRLTGAKERGAIGCWNNGCAPDCRAPKDVVYNVNAVDEEVENMNLMTAIEDSLARTQTCVQSRWSKNVEQQRRPRRRPAQH